MHLVVACTANPSIASLAFADLSAVFDSYMIRFDPFAAATRWAINPVACCVLLELSVPGLLEVLVK